MIVSVSNSSPLVDGKRKYMTEILTAAPLINHATYWLDVITIFYKHNLAVKDENEKVRFMKRLSVCPARFIL